MKAKNVAREKNKNGQPEGKTLFGLSQTLNSQSVRKFWGREELTLYNHCRISTISVRASHRVRSIRPSTEPGKGKV